MKWAFVILLVFGFSHNVWGCDACNDRDELLGSYSDFISTTNAQSTPSTTQEVSDAVPNRTERRGRASRANRQHRHIPHKKPKSFIRSFSDMGR